MSLDVAQERAEGLREAHAAQTVGFGDIQISSTLSTGIATYPRHGQEPNQLIGNADHALYRAKQAGRNRVVAFSLEGAD